MLQVGIAESACSEYSVPFVMADECFKHQQALSLFHGVGDHRRKTGYVSLVQSFSLFLNWGSSSAGSLDCVMVSPVPTCAV